MALSIEVFLYPTPSPYLVAFPLSFASFLYWKNGLERSIVVDINKPTRIHIENSGYENWDSKQSQQQDFFSGFSYLVLPLLHMFFYDFRLGDKILKSSSTNKTITFKSYHFFFSVRIKIFITLMQKLICRAQLNPKNLFFWKIIKTQRRIGQPNFEIWPSFPNVVIRMTTTFGIQFKLNKSHHCNTQN